MTYIGLQLALLILVCVGWYHVTALFVASTALQFLAAIFMAALSFMDHNRSPRPSVLLSSYLLVTLLFDITETRTFWLASATKSEITFTSVYTATTAVKAGLLLLEAQHKTRWVNWDTKENHSPEETSGIFDLGVFFWLNALFKNGYRSILQIEDLYPLDYSMQGKTLSEQFRSNLEYDKLRSRKYGLIQLLWRTLKTPILLPVAPRLLLLGFTFCQPFFINSLLDYLSENGSNVSSNSAYGFIGASILIFSGIALSTSIYQYLHNRTLQMLRGCESTFLVTIQHHPATKAFYRHCGMTNAPLECWLTFCLSRSGHCHLHKMYRSSSRYRRRGTIRDLDEQRLGAH